MFPCMHHTLFCIVIDPLSCEIAMGDIQSEEGRDIVLELELPALSSASDSAQGILIATAELSYFNIITSQLDVIKSQLKTDRTGNAANTICN